MNNMNEVEWEDGSGMFTGCDPKMGERSWEGGF